MLNFLDFACHRFIIPCLVFSALNVLAATADAQAAFEPEPRPRRGELEAHGTDFADLETRLQRLQTGLERVLPKAGADPPPFFDWALVGMQQNEIGLISLRLSRFDAARRYLQAALDTYRTKIPGAADVPSRDQITCMANLGLLHQQLGDYEQALSQYRQVLKLSRQLGDAPELVADAQNDLGGLYYQMGNYSEAEKYYRQAVATYRHSRSSQRALAGSLHNLALTAERRGAGDEAERLLAESLTLAAESAGKESTSYAKMLESMALLLSRKGEVDRPRQMFQQALTIYEEIYRKEHPAYARTLNNLGMHDVRTGDLERAQQRLISALALCKEIFGSHHLDTADTQYDLARLADAREDYPEALAQLSMAMATAKTAVAMASRAQSEHQQLIMASHLRTYLNHFLSVSQRADSDPAGAYQWVLDFKGKVFARERWLRLGRSVPELREVFDRLQQVTVQLTNLALAEATRSENSRDELVRQLMNEKAALEQKLAAASAAKRDTPFAVSFNQWRSVFPKDAVLIDFFQYRHVTPTGPSIPKPGEQRMIAFVVPQGGAIRRVDLGPATKIDEAVDEWRRWLSTPGAHSKQSAAARVVRRLVWEPLADHVPAGDAKTVLISPDGSLNRVPFAALPGAAKDRYLIEDYPLAVLPVPQFLPQLLAPPELGISEEEPLRILLVGGVNFDKLAAGSSGSDEKKPPRRRRRRAGGIFHWDALPATRGEALTIADSFRQVYDDGSVKLLTGSNALEGTVRANAPTADYMHFATHGFFAPRELRSALTGSRGAATSGPLVAYHPGLLSGLIFAGANQPAADGDDGVLTALDVAELDLQRAELAVLSACETGLGEVADGEGVLGLQRAFQVAGVKSVISSLWKVDDQQTRQLMERFYENYWQREMDMLPALRAAQLWMLQSGPRRDFRLRTDKPKATLPKNSPPYYWAGFVLSGDWR